MQFKSMEHCSTKVLAIQPTAEPPNHLEFKPLFPDIPHLIAARGSVAVQCADLPSLDGVLMRRGYGEAISLNKEQKRLAGLWGLLSINQNERDRDNADCRELIGAAHPVLHTKVLDYPINLEGTALRNLKAQFPTETASRAHLAALMEPYCSVAAAHDFVEKLQQLATPQH